MEPLYTEQYIKPEMRDDYYEHLLQEVPWVEFQANRKECFMSPVPLKYGYGSFHGSPIRQYDSVGMHPIVMYLMRHLNKEQDANYNVCFLNRYDDERKSLGWHADDSPEMNTEHPISVISFGSPREIWWRPKEQKGTVPSDQRKLLAHGSLFVMPAGFQKDHYHRIPKADHHTGPRISLTYRNYLPPA